MDVSDKAIGAFVPMLRCLDLPSCNPKMPPGSFHPAAKAAVMDTTVAAAAVAVETVTSIIILSAAVVA